MLTFGGHLEVLRQMLFRILGVVTVFAMVIFYFKESTWKVLLAPSDWDFCTYKWIESAMQHLGAKDFRLEEFHVNLITTDLSSQFMIHVTTAIYLGILATSPYILFESFRFLSPALYENEKKYSIQVTFIVYLLFAVGVLMNYFIIFPISFRFLGTYSVAERVHSTITLDSYVETFTTLTFIMVFVFQLPVITFAMAKLGFISSEILSKYRKQAFLITWVIAAIITPPDIATLLLVAVPLYLLYELSIKVVIWVQK